MEPCTVGSRVMVVTTSIHSYYLFLVIVFFFFKAIMIITGSFVLLTLYFMAWIDRPPFYHLLVLSESESL